MECFKVEWKGVWRLGDGTGIKKERDGRGKREQVNVLIKVK